MMILEIDWEELVIRESDVLQIQLQDLDDFYVSAADFDKLNLYFILLTSFHHYIGKAEREKAAHLSFLIAYYLFTALTPPGSCELAMYYIKTAFSLNPLDIYKDWLALIEKGN